MPLTDLDDCGDSACIFATSRGGMRTNGGCQHLGGGPAELRAMLRAAAARIASQRAELEAARAVVAKAHHASWCTRGRSGEPFTPCDECAGCQLRLALTSYDAAKAGKAVE